jgi:hypothetical protein
MAPKNCIKCITHHHVNCGDSVHRLKYKPHAQTSVWQEPKANTNAAYKICDLAYKILKV